MANVVFVDGLHYEPKELEKMPWLKASLSFRVDDFIQLLEKHKNERGFVNVDVKVDKRVHGIVR